MSRAAVEPQDFAACRALARSHVENFAVGSLLLPARLRDGMAAIYAAARSADDLADEPGIPDHARDAALRAFEAGLLRATAGEWVDHFALRACGATIRAHALPVDAFQALFRAFRRDLVETRYEDFDELLGYCADSANPVGRLVLALFGVHDARLLPASDAICSGLQLVNHWQDVAADAGRGRIYLPRADLRRFGVSEEDVLARRDSPALRALLAFETERARALLLRGGALVDALRGRLRLEVALLRRAGLAAADALARARFAVMAGPPRAGRRAKALALGSALADCLRPARPPALPREVRA